MMSVRERRRLDRLRRRRDHLALRIRNAGDGIDLSYDKAEWAALEWAVDRLEYFYGCAIEGKRGSVTANESEIKESP